MDDGIARPSPLSRDEAPGAGAAPTATAPEEISPSLGRALPRARGGLLAGSSAVVSIGRSAKAGGAAASPHAPPTPAPFPEAER